MSDVLKFLLVTSIAVTFSGATPLASLADGPRTEAASRHKTTTTHAKSSSNHTHASLSTADTSPAAGEPNPAAAAPGELTPQERLALIKESQNPVGNIAILPFQSNWNYAAGPTKTTVWNLNIQPVVPIMLSPKANLIERVILPVVNITPLVPQEACSDLGLAPTTLPCGAELGISNIQLESFYAPKVPPNSFIWGVGPIFSFPTVSKNLGTQQWGGGIDAVGLVMPGSWVLGALVNQRWHIAGPSASSEDTLNSFLAQPFIDFNFGKGWALSEAPEITANWNKPGDQKWTVPIGLGISNTNTWLKLPMSYALEYYGNIVRPRFAPYGLIRFNWSLLWPVKRGRP